IGAAVHVVAQHFLAGRTVQGEHGSNRRGHVRLAGDGALQCGSDDAGAEGLGEDQGVARPRAGVGQDARGVNDAGDGVAEFDLVIRHAVAAEDGAAGLVHHLGAALEDGLQIPRVFLGRPSQHGERGDGAAAHGIDVTQRVGRGDGAVGVRVIDDGREEIHCLHQGELRRQLVHAGIVGSVKPYQHILVGPTGHASQNPVQQLWTQLAGSTGGLHVGGQLSELGGIVHASHYNNEMRRTAVFSAVLLLALGFTLVSREPGTDPRLRNASRSRERGGWIQVHLEGKPGEIGFQHGVLLAAEIKDTFQAVSWEMVHEEKKDWAFFRKTAEQVFWQRVEPEYREELSGIAEGLKFKGVKLDIWDVVALNAWLELPYY